jgi:hypothetical protein
MTSYYVPSVTHFWGDNITALWTAEFLHHLQPDANITLDTFAFDKGIPFEHDDWVDISSFAKRGTHMSPEQAQKKFDRVIATHHRHGVKRTLYPNVDGNRLTYFDAHGLIVRFIADEWYPTLHPQQCLLGDFDRLNLPNDYFALHVNDTTSRPDGRNVLPAGEYFTRNRDAILEAAGGRPIVSTGARFPGSIDVSSEQGWVKIYVLYKAYEFWGSLSGFTSIPAVYRRRVRCSLVNEPYPASLNLGPPSVCYGDYDVTNHGCIDALYEQIRLGNIKHASGAEYFKRCHDVRQWCQFETFEYYNLAHTYATPAPPREQFYENVDNCLVAFNTRYVKHGFGRDMSFMNDTDRDMTSLLIMGWGPRP